MKLTVAFFALIVAGCAAYKAADDVVAYNKTRTQAVVLHQTPCVSKESLRLIKPEYHKNFEKAATFHGHGPKPIAGCYWLYAVPGEVMVITVWEDGDSIPLNPAQFEPLKGSVDLKPKGDDV